MKVIGDQILTLFQLLSVTMHLHVLLMETSLVQMGIQAICASLVPNSMTLGSSKMVKVSVLSAMTTKPTV
jgi:galactokinase